MSYKIHHLNCGTMCGGDKPLLRYIMPPLMSCHCLLVESHRGLLLIDTGFGVAETQKPSLLGNLFLNMSAPILKEEETALRQIEKLGYKATDVSDILVTHLHLDHAGGITDFPNASVHVYKEEYDAAKNPANMLEKGGYLPRQWSNAQWKIHETKGEKWMGFDAVQAFDPDENILIVPLTGHSKGHSGIAVKSENGWILHCGDAYFDQREMDPLKPDAPLGIKIYQNLLNADKEKRIQNQNRLRALHREHGMNIRLICSHDYDDFCTCSRKNTANV